MRIEFRFGIRVRIAVPFTVMSRIMVGVMVRVRIRISARFSFLDVITVWGCGLYLDHRETMRRQRQCWLHPYDPLYRL